MFVAYSHYGKRLYSCADPLRLTVVARQAVECGLSRWVDIRPQSSPPPREDPFSPPPGRNYGHLDAMAGVFRRNK